MKLIIANMKWIMLVSGILTCSMTLALLAPQAQQQFMFGESLNGPLAEIIVRNWGALIALGGALLIYGAYNLAVRPLTLVAASISKTIFIILVLTYGQQFLDHQVKGAVIGDLLMVILFATYLIGTRNK
ncbi:MAG: hypothetical protein SF097_02465 [Acidobacteriota bacterium]|nr:hypothetical protein [Acidobacteriota bacterium]